MTLKDELIAAIENEENYFNMCHWDREAEGVSVDYITCDTASCMGGWLNALRPELSASLLGHNSVSLTARHIWEQEMGEICQLDFYAYNYRDAARPAHELLGGGTVALTYITRQQAIAHIKQELPEWPHLQNTEFTASRIRRPAPAMPEPPTGD